VGGKNLKRIPIRIEPGGTVPFINDDNTENIKYVGESYLVNNRELQDVESELLTYELDRAGKEAKAPIVVLFNSGTGNSEEPPKIKSDPNIKGSILYLDTAKGQELGNPIPMPPGVVISVAKQGVQAMQNAGGLSRIAFGEIDITMTATGTDILNHNTREHIWPFKLGMENDYKWMAQEIARQYKEGGFPKSDFEGYVNDKRFSTKLKPSDIVCDKEFTVELVMDEITDRPTHSGMAIQERKAGLLPLRELLDVHHLSDDPDRSMAALAQEQFEQSSGSVMVKGLVALIEDYSKTKDKGKLMEIDFALQMMQQFIGQATGQGGQGGGLPEEGQSAPLAAKSKATTPRTAQATVPRPVQEAAQNAQ